MQEVGQRMSSYRWMRGVIPSSALYLKRIAEPMLVLGLSIYKRRKNLQDEHKY